ncbi:MAG TPA: AAA family ATPase, partial [Candidatus Dormibacteraeota bacterium]|nr:AAA family ATPase [Candidatus Dormibacteraeota bacterium]
MPARARRPGNLPSEATSFIGRRHELAEVRQALASARLVSLVGPGGVGKTRLALRAASDLARAYRDGAWLVELAEIRDPDLVWNAVLEALDLRDQATTEPLDLVLSNLADKQLLLVVDNCEHLLESAARLASEVVKTARAVRVLATSREPLSAPGESVVPVPPLDLPSGEPNKPLHQVRENEAVALFMERAASASGRFELTPANLATVVELCRHLDGLPLAIELAAVRTRVLAVDQILDRLGDRFALLTGGSRAALPRHQTLRTTIDWSYDLLTVGEKTLLRRLCVFAGSFSLEDIEAICASPALDDLSSLIDKSLVIREEGGRIARYRLHETMREYALTKLREAGEEESAREKFVQHYVATCERSVDEGAYFLAPWLHWIESEIDNIRLALQWLLLAKDSARGTALAGSAGWFWVTRATTEGVRWLDEFLGADAGDPAALALAYFIRGFIATLQGDAGAAESALTRAALLAPATRRPWLAVQSLAAASVVLNLTGDHARAQPFLDEAQANADAHASRRAWVAVLQARSTNAFVEGDLEGVKAASSECARLSAEDGDLYTLAYSLINLGFGAMFTGETVAARRFFEDGLSAARQIDDRLAQFYLLDALGC